MSVIKSVTGFIRKALTPAGRGGWWPLWVREPFAGAWQQNKELRQEELLHFYAVFACVSLIASDIGKLNARTGRYDSDGIWSETKTPQSTVLDKPNSFQNQIQFKEYWLISKLRTGNTYVLKSRDARGQVTGLYVLDPFRVTPLVSDSGDVYYQLNADNLAGIDNSVTVPASEIIHDRMNCLYHPLVGVSPLVAAALAAGQGISIQNNSTLFFANGAYISGVLTAPGPISDAAAESLRQQWAERYSGPAGIGKVPVLGDGLKFEPMRTSAVDSQLLEQLRWAAEAVCTVFHVPPYKVGIGALPSYNNVEALDQQYYSQCLQILIESMETCMTQGLGLSELWHRNGPGPADAPWNADDNRHLANGHSGIMAPNEARRKLNLKPVTGGNTPYMQQQNYSLAALDKRDTTDVQAARAMSRPKP